ncbi:hypothetical protein P5G62_003480 [Neobacillus sp. 179-C4.2 HS]|uniref:Uncharacterized protein n=1 Tax=Neobacillus driksii TaxID=3035913 RepID=A0ABV4YMW6_9BACI|nr:hypothetical protein [Neobacillus sp. 179.-C4.2 HS]MDP5193507.1 hypothetical protein [Neobacillus sp. 179.-C4.2 HS]
MSKQHEEKAFGSMQEVWRVTAEHEEKSFGLIQEVWSDRRA